MGKIIGVISLKGGVGKTSLVVSLGDAIAKFGKKVLLIDANFSSPNLGLHLNVVDPEITLHHVLSRKANLKEAVCKLENFDLLPASIFHRMMINPLNLKNIVKKLKSKYDYVIIDSSPAFGDEILATILASDELLVVTTSDYPTLSSTLKAVKLANQRGAKINGLVLNKVYNKNFELSLEDIEKTVEMPVMAVIPYDINFLKALSESIPSTSYKPKSCASVECKKLAATMIGQKYKPFKLGNLFKITPNRQEINREVFYERVFN